MSRCPTCRRRIWPWQESVAFGAEHRPCWERRWDDFFGAVGPEWWAAKASGRTFWSLVLETPERWQTALLAARDALPVTSRRL